MFCRTSLGYIGHRNLNPITGHSKSIESVESITEQADQYWDQAVTQISREISATRWDMPGRSAHDTQRYNTLLLNE